MLDSRLEKLPRQLVSSKVWWISQHWHGGLFTEVAKHFNGSPDFSNKTIITIKKSAQGFDLQQNNYETLR